MQSTLESGTRASYDGAKRRKGSKVHVAFVDQGYTGDQARHDAASHGIKLDVVNTASAGRHASTAWRATTSGCPICSQSCIFLR